MGYVHPDSLKVKNYRCICRIRIWMLEATTFSAPCRSAYFRRYRYAPGRCPIADLPAIYQPAKKLSLKNEGIMSHFAMGDKPNHPLTVRQTSEFQKAVVLPEYRRESPFLSHYRHSSALSTVTTFKSWKLCQIGFEASMGITPVDSV